MKMSDFTTYLGAGFKGQAAFGKAPGFSRLKGFPSLSMLVNPYKSKAQ